MKERALELSVGLFVLAGLACVAYLAVHLGKIGVPGSGTYAVTARFNDATGLRAGADIEISGVKVGRVDAIRLDQKGNVALVDLRLPAGIKLTDDSIVSIKGSGLIGDKFIKISPGGSDTYVAAGGMLIETESSVDIQELMSKYVFGSVRDDKGKEKDKQ